jgi:hypothetical protein
MISRLAQYLLLFIGLKHFKNRFMPDKKLTEENKNIKKQNDSSDENEHVEEAFEEAEKDIEKDPEFKHDEDEDLNEGELARKEGHP